MKLYVVQMYRWGNEDGHSYIEGVYDSRSLAKKHGMAEVQSRAGKYEFKIWVHPLNQPRRLKYMTKAQSAADTKRVRALIKKKFPDWDIPEKG